MDPASSRRNIPVVWRAQEGPHGTLETWPGPDHGGASGHSVSRHFTVWACESAPGGILSLVLQEYGASSPLPALPALLWQFPMGCASRPFASMALWTWAPWFPRADIPGFVSHPFPFGWDASTWVSLFSERTLT